VSADDTIPVVFGADTNLVWRVPMVPGNSSPCVWDGTLFLTGFVDPELQTLCFDAGDGRLRWQRSVVAGPGERGSGLGSPAAPTPCTDGERVFSYFGPFGVVCHDFSGRELWRRELPVPLTQHGVGTSPVLAGSLLILLRDQDAGSHLLALDKATGNPVWRTERPEFRRGFCTPLVTAWGGEDLVIAPGTTWVAAYAVRDGRERWRVPGLPNEVCASPVAGSGLVFAGGWTSGAGAPRMPDFDLMLAGGDADQDGRLGREEAPGGPARQHFAYMDADRDGTLTREEYGFIAGVFQRSQNALLALQSGGDSDGGGRTNRVVWSANRGLPYVPTPLVWRDRVILVKNGGLVSCLNATNGVACYQEERLGVIGDNYASPVAADDRVVVASQNGTLTVFRLADSLEVLARNALGEPVLATPAIANDTLFVRSQRQLWAFREMVRAAR
jgi:outer membrane protein assembly factor BamB